jgi:hypothetical protein
LPGTEAPNCIDIRDAVYLRMAPCEVREEVRFQGSITEELEAKIFEWMFPAIREEALFWYQAGKGRGIVVCEGASMTYVPAHHLAEFLQAARRGGLSKAEAAVTSYDPHREAVIAVVREEYLGIAVIGPSAADPLLQLIQ